MMRILQQLSVIALVGFINSVLSSDAITDQDVPNNWDNSDRNQIAAHNKNIRRHPVQLYKGEQPWRPLSPAIAFGVRQQQHSSNSNAGEGAAPPELPAEDGKTPNDGTLNVPIEVPVSNAENLDEQPESLTANDYTADQQQQNGKKRGKIDLHESLRRPLKRLTDRQLALLLKQIRKQRHRQFSRESKETEEANKDLAVAQENVNRSEMLAQIRDLLKQPQQEGGEQRLIRPKLLTNINILPSEWNIYPIPARHRQNATTTIQQPQPQQPQPQQQQPQQQNGTGGKWESENAQQIPVHTINIGGHLYDLSDGNETATEHGETAASPTSSSSTSTTSATFEMRASIRPPIVHSFDLAPLLEPETTEASVKISDGSMESLTKAQTEEQESKLPDLNVDSPLAKENISSLSAIDITIPSSENNEPGKKQAEDRKVEKLADGWQQVEQKFLTEMRNAVQKTDAAIANLEIKRKEAEKSKNPDSTSPLLFSSKTLELSSEHHDPQQQPIGPKSAEFKLFNVSSRFSDKERVQLAELSTALRDIRIRYETVKRQFLNKMKLLGIAHRFQGPPSSSSFKAAGVPSFLVGSEVTQQEQNTTEQQEHKNSTVAVVENRTTEVTIPSTIAATEITTKLAEELKIPEQNATKTAEVEEATTVSTTASSSITTTVLTQSPSPLIDETTTTVSTTASSSITTTVLTQSPSPLIDETTTTVSTTASSPITFTTVSTLSPSPLPSPSTVAAKKAAKGGHAKQKPKLTLSELAAELEQIEQAIAGRQQTAGAGAEELEEDFDNGKLQKAKKILRSNKKVKQQQQKNRARVFSSKPSSAGSSVEKPLAQQQATLPQETTVATTNTTTKFLEQQRQKPRKNAKGSRNNAATIAAVDDGRKRTAKTRKQPQLQLEEQLQQSTNKNGKQQPQLHHQLQPVQTPTNNNKAYDQQQHHLPIARPQHSPQTARQRVAVATTNVGSTPQRYATTVLKEVLVDTSTENEQVSHQQAQQQQHPQQQQPNQFFRERPQGRRRLNLEASITPNDSPHAAEMTSSSVETQTTKTLPKFSPQQPLPVQEFSPQLQQTLQPHRQLQQQQIQPQLQQPHPQQLVNQQILPRQPQLQQQFGQQRQIGHTTHIKTAQLNGYNSQQPHQQQQQKLWPTSTLQPAGFYQLHGAQVADVDPKPTTPNSSLSEQQVKVKGVAQVEVGESIDDQPQISNTQLSKQLRKELKQQKNNNSRTKSGDGKEEDVLTHLEEFARIDEQAICDAIGCNFESGSLCEWQSSVDQLDPEDPRYTARTVLMMRHRAKRELEQDELQLENNTNNEKKGAKQYPQQLKGDQKAVLRSWHNWVGRYRNRLTGIARAEVFSTRNQRFAASYVKPGQRSTLTGRVLSGEKATIRFRAYEATRDIQLRVCCDRTDEEKCVFETERGVKRGSRKWKEQLVTCPQGTKKIIFECRNIGQFQGACGIDDIQLVNEHCPSVTPMKSNRL